MLFVTPYEIVHTFKAMNLILKCDHSSESNRTVLSCGAVCFLSLLKENLSNFLERFWKQYDLESLGAGGGGGGDLLVCFSFFIVLKAILISGFNHSEKAAL